MVTILVREKERERGREERGGEETEGGTVGRGEMESPNSIIGKVHPVGEIWPAACFCK